MWPPDKRAGAVLSFDFDAEEVWLAEDTANAHRPGVLSQGRYGAKVGVPLILDLLGEAEVHATFFVPGAVAARYPERLDIMQSHSDLWIATARQVAEWADAKLQARADA